MYDPGRDSRRGSQAAWGQLIGWQLVALSTSKADYLVAATEVRFERRAGHLAPDSAPLAGFHLQISGDRDANDRRVEQAVERRQAVCRGRVREQTRARRALDGIMRSREVPRDDHAVSGKGAVDRAARIRSVHVGDVLDGSCA